MSDFKFLSNQLLDVANLTRHTTNGKDAFSKATLQNERVLRVVSSRMCDYGDSLLILHDPTFSGYHMARYTYGRKLPARSATDEEITLFQQMAHSEGLHHSMMVRPTPAPADKLSNMEHFSHSVGALKSSSSVNALPDYEQLQFNGPLSGSAGIRLDNPWPARTIINQHIIRNYPNVFQPTDDGKLVGVVVQNGQAIYRRQEQAPFDQDAAFYELMSWKTAAPKPLSPVEIPAHVGFGPREDSHISAFPEVVPTKPAAHLPMPHRGGPRSHLLGTIADITKARL